MSCLDYGKRKFWKAPTYMVPSHPHATRGSLPIIFQSVVYIIHCKYLCKDGKEQSDSRKSLSKHIWSYLRQRASANHSVKACGILLGNRNWPCFPVDGLVSKQFWSALISQIHLNALRQSSRRPAQCHVGTLLRFFFFFEERACSWSDTNSSREFNIMGCGVR